MTSPSAPLFALGALLISSAAGAQPASRDFGVTAEAGVSVGMVRLPGAFDTTRFDSPLFGVHAGAAAWLTPQLALGGLFSAAGYNHASAADRTNYRHGFLGPSLQYWFTSWLWVSGGIGLGVLRRKLVDQPQRTDTGLAFDLRAGRSFQVAGPTHQLEIALELIPSHYDLGGATKNYQILLVTFGYQLL